MGIGSKIIRKVVVSSLRLSAKTSPRELSEFVAKLSAFIDARVHRLDRDVEDKLAENLLEQFFEYVELNNDAADEIEEGSTVVDALGRMCGKTVAALMSSTAANLELRNEALGIEDDGSVAISRSIAEFFDTATERVFGDGVLDLGDFVVVRGDVIEASKRFVGAIGKA